MSVSDDDFEIVDVGVSGCCFEVNWINFGNVKISNIFIDLETSVKFGRREIRYIPT